MSSFNIEMNENILMCLSMIHQELICFFFGVQGSLNNYVLYVKFRFSSIPMLEW